MKRQYNEKPSSVANIGQDIEGAARHHRDTYETPEELRKKAFKKLSTKELKGLLSEYQAKLSLALSESTEAAKAVLIEYEIKKALKSCDLFASLGNASQAEIKAHVLSSSGQDRELMRKKYNHMARKISDIKYMRPIKVPAYFDKKEVSKFKEVNGHEVAWKTESKSFDVEFLKSNVAAVQYGNSLTENERIYVSEKLIESIRIMSESYVIDFKSLGFSYGARGKAGSIAHYEDASKVLAFNRGWDGAFIHELGHAIDYALGKISRSMPYEIRSKYRTKLETHPAKMLLNIPYLMKPTEIFARMFEAYIKQTMPNATSFMIFLATDSTLPDLDAETLAWFEAAITPILKRGES